MAYGHRHCGLSKRAYKRFLTQNKGTLLLSVVVLLGVTLGSCIFPTLSDDYRRFLLSVYQPTTIPFDFVSGCTYACSVAFRAVIMLIALFLSGLTAFGWPLNIMILLLFGIQVGVTDCAVFVDSGWLALVVTEILPLLCIFGGIVHTARGSFCMSTALAKQLLPSAAHCGSMWYDFKHYLAANGISVLLVLLAAVIKTLIRMYW